MKYAWRKKTTRKIIMVRIAISVICPEIRGNNMAPIASGLLAFSRFDKDEPKTYANTKTIIIRASEIDRIKLRTKGTQMFRFLIYVPKPLLIILPISSTIFIILLRFNDLIIKWVQRGLIHSIKDIYRLLRTYEEIISKI